MDSEERVTPSYVRKQPSLLASLEVTICITKLYHRLLLALLSTGADILG